VQYLFDYGPDRKRYRKQRNESVAQRRIRLFSQLHEAYVL
jgi:hypothetical protein